jgi:Protein of unknown function (DUF1059)
MTQAIVHCDCGYRVEASDESELIAAVQRHARDAHAMVLSWDQARTVALSAQVEERRQARDEGGRAR